MLDVHKRPTKVLIVDAHPLVLPGYRSLFADDRDLQIVGAADACSGYIAFVQEKAEIVVVNIALPDVSGFDLIRRIRRENPDIGIIVFSMDQDPALVVRAVEMGAQGYLSKSDDPSHFAQAIRNVRAGENYISPNLATTLTFYPGNVQNSRESKLTKREFEVLVLLRRGDTIAEIAKDLALSYKTVANATSLVRKKLGAKSHSDLIRIAVEMKLG